MLSKSIKIVFMLISFTFLTGFVPLFSLFGPGMTILSSGNVYKAGTQYLIDYSIKETTGKSSLVYVKDEIKKKNNKKNLDKEIRELVEKRIKLARKKLNLKNINQ